MQHLRPFFISRRYNDLQILHSALAESSHDGRRNDSRSNKSQFHKLLPSLSPLRLPEIFPDDSERTFLIVTPPILFTYTVYNQKHIFSSILLISRRTFPVFHRNSSLNLRTPL